MTAEVVVVGAGHAGLEAAFAAARTGARTAIVTMSWPRAGAMSCNPSIGGVAKGILVMEIDALGGRMGEAADGSAIQSRMLNMRKGPAGRGPRVQCDPDLYSGLMRTAASGAGVRIVEGEAAAFDWDGDRIGAVILDSGRRLPCRSVVLAPGTFLGGRLFRGRERWRGGRSGEPPSDALLEHIVRRGFHVERFKTGTPPRVLASSLDMDGLEVQPEDGPAWRFSRRGEVPGPAVRAVCYTTRTGPATLAAVEAGAGESPLLGGCISGRGPRYCPSFEDKAGRFPGRPGHPVFLEPKRLGSRLVYVNGRSTSMPRTAQVEMVRSLPGCSRAVVASWGYAVEYSWLPRAMDASCGSVICPNLFLAGQVCGTSGYEEAAALGLLAGRMAAAEALGMPRLVPEAESSYLGVMAHDISQRDFGEPYRLFSSRAGNRMHLRPDNALRRLLRTAVGIGLGRPGDAEEADRLEARERELMDGLRRTVREGRSLAAMCRTPGYDADEAARVLGLTGDGDLELLRSLALDLRYEGYIDRALRRAGEAERLSGLVLGIEDFSTVAGVSLEARQALQSARPRTLSEASAVPAVRPSDVEGLMVHVSRRAAARPDG